jgi:hypothetical protein
LIIKPGASGRLVRLLDVDHIGIDAIDAGQQAALEREGTHSRAQPVERLCGFGLGWPIGHGEWWRLGAPHAGRRVVAFVGVDTAVVIQQH